MNLAVEKHLIKAIADFAVFLEFTESDLLNEDVAIQAMEQLASELQFMNADVREMVSQELAALAPSYPNPEQRAFVEQLPSALGLE